ncbi:cysteine-rich receptor-like protein kinase 3 [Benincasa hispida]|uniref:cysteine-rich receptor-like protein kinase 3 n=1 Tax=Benincasa hispida TaxID=102211 RepID=UPI0018FF8566|nr:cysteine-rich receptor-like protein kinase 3 [Benincasa hispida]
MKPYNFSFAIPFLLILSLFHLLIQSSADPRATEAALICSNNTASPPERSTFVANFLDSMDAVTPLISSQRFAAVVNGTGNTTVYAFGECMNDLTQSDCDLCFAQMKTQILRCLPFQLATRGGRLFYDGCYIRYDYYNFFNESLSGVDRNICGKLDYSGNRTIFSDNAMKLARNLSVVAPKNNGFAVGLVDFGNVSVYGSGQCWKFVKGGSCSKCLVDAAKEIGSCPPKTEGRVLNAGCYFRYSTERFYFNSTATAAGGNGSRRLAIILASISAAVATALIISTVVFCARRRVVRKRKEKKQLGPLVAIVNKSKLNFSYETLERATNYFDQSNKLGQGGSGSVYKGTLSDGRVVAIKRLFFNTRQWVDHFFNEVNLISGIRHKNLVGLLGCSITGPESLLVYEYVPNQSLHDYLFGNKNVQPLSWESRFKIVLGTAEGLAYLHEESNVKIIHRDIKLSNILLDNDFTPKIADFGLARLLPEDKTHISTAIAGTLGYMAPEYVVRGKLSEKADVYSFGVFAIEVITGRRNNHFFQDSTSILQKVWNLYGEGRLYAVVDPILAGDHPRDKASQLLQIGLVCVQAYADLRPSMSMVVKMLTANYEIPQPKQPPYLHPSSGNMKPQNSSDSSNPNLYYNSRSSQNSMTQSIIDPR